jgi:hypothetical protein
MRPDLRRLTVLKEEKVWLLKNIASVTHPSKWVAKIGKEAQSETAAVRLLWGLGYVTEVNYLAPQVTLPGRNLSKCAIRGASDGWKRLDPWN